MLALAVGTASAQAKPQPTPVIFVHGQSGSAQQFETDAMRLTSNGFPQDRIFAYEYNTLISNNDAAVADLDGFIADVKAQTGASQVDILAHSRGTTVMHTYLSTPERAASVSHYVNFDGRTSTAPPGGVPTLAIWGEGDQTREIVGATNVYFPNKAHTEVTTSRQAFVALYEFLEGDKPETKNVLPEDPKKVTVAGRVSKFPDNTGIAGALLEVFELDSATGHRASATPVYSLTIDAGGAFGPLKVNGKKHYEFAVSEPGQPVIHNYPEPFEHDDHLYRVLNAPLLRPSIESGPNSTGITVTRMREFWGDQSDPNFVDTLTLGATNVINPATAPRARRVLAVFTFDKNSDGVTDTSASLAPFNGIGFLTGVDVFNAASPDASGTIPVSETMRGNRRHEETINVPNWASDQDFVSVYFKDYAAKAFQRSRTGNVRN